MSSFRQEELAGRTPPPISAARRMTNSLPDTQFSFTTNHQAENPIADTPNDHATRAFAKNQIPDQNMTDSTRTKYQKMKCQKIKTYEPRRRHPLMNEPTVTPSAGGRTPTVTSFSPAKHVSDATALRVLPSTYRHGTTANSIESILFTTPRPVRQPFPRRTDLSTNQKSPAPYNSLTNLLANSTRISSEIRRELPKNSTPPIDQKDPPTTTHNRPRRPVPRSTQTGIQKSIRSWISTGKTAPLRDPKNPHFPDVTPIPAPHATTDRSTPSDLNLENLPWGDPIHEKRPESYRIYLQNVNGIRSSDSFAQACEYAVPMLTKAIDCWCIVETKLAWTSHLRSLFKSSLRPVWPKLALATSNSSMTFSSDFQPGGTATVLMQGLADRVTEVASDPSGLGRWSGFKLQGRSGTCITILTAYQVPQGSIALLGPTMAYSQQWSLLQRSGLTDPDPRQSFITDIIAYAEQELTLNHELLIALDANESLHNTKSGIRRFLQLGLVDVHLERFGVQQEPATYNRGTKRIDYIFATANLSQYIVQAGIEPFYSGVVSDHRGVYIDLSHSCLQSVSDILTPPTTDRLLHSYIQSDVNKYQSALMKYLDDHRVDDRLRGISQIPICKRSGQLEKIDRDLSCGMLRAELTCTKRHTAPWSPEILQARRMVSYWNLWSTQIRTHRCTSAARESMIANHATEGYHWISGKI